MRRLIYYLLASLFPLLLNAQKMGGWKSFMAYNQVSQVIETKEKVYALGNGVLFSVVPDLESVETYSKITGLSDAFISHIAYNKTLDAIILVYENSNIDLIKNGSIINIADLKRKEISGKQVHNVSTFGKYAYLSTSIGIVIVDMQREEIADTYIIGPDGSYLATYATEIVNNDIYTLTPNGLLHANLKDKNLADYSKWNTLKLSETPTSIHSLGESLIVAVTDSICRFNLQDTSLVALHKTTNFKHAHSDGSYLTIIDDIFLYTYNTAGIEVDQCFADYCRDAIYRERDHSYWVAKSINFSDYVNGIYNLFVYKNHTIANKYEPNGPMASSVAFLKFENNMLITGSGGRFDIPELDHKGIVQILENNQWTIITDANFTEESKNPYTPFVDVLDAIVDPRDPKRIYVASWRSLFEIYDKVPVRQYWTENTTLVNQGDRILVDGLCFDKDNNLWMVNMLSPNGLVVKSADGQWGSYAYNGIENKGTIKETFISHDGLVWILCPRLSVGAGVVVINQNGTPFNSFDDKSKYYSSFRDKDGNIVTPNAFRCIAEDKNNIIWIGTSAGPLLINDRSRIFNNDFTINRIKITREDDTNYADYLLGSDQINAIVVDGGNRKWLGSATSGVYLLSEDGQETLQHFTTENSPLTSNAIIDLAMNHETGELFIATSNGLFSYMTDASEGKESYNGVYVYPNPVAPDFDGDITIKGLVENSFVRIADVEGNVITEGYSNGGTFTWDGRNKANRRVATGIYYIFAAQDDGSMKMMTKVAFIH